MPYIKRTHTVVAGVPTTETLAENGVMWELSVGSPTVYYQVFDYVTRRLLLSKQMVISTNADLANGDTVGTYASTVSVTFTQTELDSLVATDNTDPYTAITSKALAKQLYWQIEIVWANGETKIPIGGLFTKG
jgi:hypothetical protein